MTVPSIDSQGSIQSAIAFASRRTGVDFNYLLGQAQVESGMRADAHAPTSSASGLYQFVEQSWLGVVKSHGAEYGLGWAADAIRQTGSGHYVVSDPQMRQSILGLRNDPQVASLMAAEHASDNKTALEGSLGRSTNGTDLYMAHFLGLGGARNFLGAMASDPGQSGAALFPTAARANHAIFYADNGAPRSLAEIYSNFTDKLGQGVSSAGGTAIAAGSSTSTLARALAGTALANGGEVIPGAGALNGDSSWVASTLANLNSIREVNPLRPTPQTAKLAYLMLASLGA